MGMQWYFTRLLKSLSLITILFLFASDTLAQSNKDRFFFAYDSEAITVDATAGGVGFTASKLRPSNPWRAELVSFRVECAAASPCDIRVIYDGTTTVTSTVGFLLEENDIVSLYGFDNLQNFKAIRTGANSATLRALYHR